MKKYYGNYRGIVKKADGKNGLCKIFVYGIYSDDLLQNLDALPNAEPAMPLTNGNAVGTLDTPPANLNVFLDSTGNHCVPEVGARVWLFFEGGDIRFPIYFASIPGGSTWLSTDNGVTVNRTKSIKLTIDESSLVTNKASLSNTIITEENVANTKVDPISFATSSADGAANPMGDLLNSMGVGEMIGDVTSQITNQTSAMKEKLAALKAKIPSIDLPKIPDPTSLLPIDSLKNYETEQIDKAKEMANTIPDFSLEDQLENIQDMSSGGWFNIVGVNNEVPEANAIAALAGLVTPLAALPAIVSQLLGIDIKCVTDYAGKVKITIMCNGDISFTHLGKLDTIQVGDKNNIQIGNTTEMGLGSMINMHTGGGLVNQLPLVGV